MVFYLERGADICEAGSIMLLHLLTARNIFFHFRDKSTTPSGFTLKLRRHIRTRRLEDVRQLGYDRVWHAVFFPLLFIYLFILYQKFLALIVEVIWKGLQNFIQSLFLH